MLFSGCVAAQATSSAEAEKMAALLDLRTGMHVADVGAGKGEWTEVLAGFVGPGGRVYATEVDEDDLDRIRDRVEDAGIDNVELLLGDQNNTGLPADCCDAIVLRLVYHHFQDPAAMRAGLHDALRPGALLMVIEIETQPHWAELSGVPDRGGHGIMPEDLLAEMTADGFEVVERLDEWGSDDDHYGVIFREIDRRETAGSVGH